MDNENNDKEQRRGFPVEITEDIAEGVYANFALVGHFQTEFLLDFAKTIPGQQKAKIKSRVIMSPIQAKRQVCKRSTPVRIIHSVPAVNKNLPRRSFKQMNTAAGRGLKNPERDISRERNFLIIQGRPMDSLVSGCLLPYHRQEDIESGAQ